MGTLIWTDGFESYAVGITPAPWVNKDNSQVVTTQPHTGTKSTAAGIGGNTTTVSRPFGSNQSQWYADFWMWTNPVGATNLVQYVSFSSSSSAATNAPCVAVDGVGAGRVGLSASGTTWFTFTTTASTWHNYVFEVLSGAAGTAKLTVDGVVVGTFSGDTRDSSSNAFVSNVWIVGSVIGPSPPAAFYVDDISIFSGVTVVAGGAQARAMVLA